MGYRPLIPREVDERVDLHMVGKQGNKNEVYQRAVKLMLDEHGNEQELATIMVDENGEPEPWLQRLRTYADETDQSPDEVLNQILNNVLDDDGEANVQFKERLQLE